MFIGKGGSSASDKYYEAPASSPNTKQNTVPLPAQPQPVNPQPSK
jgi:hypothetical protein